MALLTKLNNVNSVGVVSDPGESKPNELIKPAMVVAVLFVLVIVLIEFNLLQTMAKYFVNFPVIGPLFAKVAELPSLLHKNSKVVIPGTTGRIDYKHLFSYLSINKEIYVDGTMVKVLDYDVTANFIITTEEYGIMYLHDSVGSDFLFVDLDGNQHLVSKIDPLVEILRSK